VSEKVNGHGALPPAPAPQLAPPIQALINELTIQRDMMAQRAATFAMRLAALEAALMAERGINTELGGRLATLTRELDALKPPADDRPAAGE
jgi:CII-binding regulator of phage lambda lysogenization HflD